MTHVAHALLLALLLALVPLRVGVVAGEPDWSMVITMGKSGVQSHSIERPLSSGQELICQKDHGNHYTRGEQYRDLSCEAFACALAELQPDRWQYWLTGIASNYGVYLCWLLDPCSGDPEQWPEYIWPDGLVCGNV